MNADQINEFGSDTSKIFRLLRQIVYYEKPSRVWLKARETMHSQTSIWNQFLLWWTRNSDKNLDLILTAMNAHDPMMNKNF